MIGTWRDLAAAIVLIASAAAALSFLCGVVWKTFRMIQRIQIVVERSERQLNGTNGTNPHPDPSSERE